MNLYVLDHLGYGKYQVFVAQDDEAAIKWAETYLKVIVYRDGLERFARSYDVHDEMTPIGRAEKYWKGTECDPPREHVLFRANTGVFMPCHD